MRILTICGNLERGGTQRAAQSYSQAYHRAGHSVLVWGWHGGGVRAGYLREAGIRVIEGVDGLTHARDFKPQLIHIHRPGPSDQRWTDLLRALKRDSNRVLETNVFSRADYSNGSDLIDVHLQLSE